MNRALRTGLTLAAIVAAGAGGYWAGHRDIAVPGLHWLRSVPWLENAVAGPPNSYPAPSGPVIYYRDPDGRPAYSAVPRKSTDGRDFAAVHASEDLSFEVKPAAIVDAPAATGKAKAVLAPTFRAS